METTYLSMELGATYKTRSGGTVKIIDVDYSYSRPFFGIITRNGEHERPASYNAAGHYKNGIVSEFDIVAK